MINPSYNLIKATLWGGVGMLVSAVVSPAAVFYSGMLDIQIPASSTGVYLDLDTGGTPAPGTFTDPGGAPGYTLGYSAPAGDWDVNLFFGGIGIAYSPSFQPFVDDTVGNLSQILAVGETTVISTAASARTLGAGNEAFGGSGRSNGSSGASHFDLPTVGDASYSAFTPGQQGYIAFVINPGAAEQYGWMSVTLANDGSPGTIHSWAYSDESSFAVGQVPEPGSLLLLLAGGATLLRRRRA